MDLNISFLQRLLSNITRGKGYRHHEVAAQASSLSQLASACEALMQRGGEAHLVLKAQQALSHYAGLEEAEKHAFFSLLAEQYSARPQAIHDAYEAYRQQESNAHLQRLFQACEPRRQDLLRRLNQCPGGTYELVRMRADLLGMLRQDPALAPLDADFAHLFSSWFNRGFLVLESIDWNTPAAILEKIIRYEAVHEIRDWSDLRRRLDPDDRRCYAFFHPATGDEPLIFVEVALCRGIPGSIQGILGGGDEVAPQDADTAVFYSISNCQAGLKGISFGNFLIKQVVQELKRDLPGLRNFVTLSPVPGFAGWLDARRQADQCRLDMEQAARLDAGDWADDEAARAALRPDLQGLLAHYLVEEKHRNGQPLDPVARFHLGNGASLHRINWLADTSAKGLRQSHGLMVNYLYEPDKIEQHQEAFSREGAVACTAELRREARHAQPLLNVAAAV
ncbi:malonyl-CoA decarboxylase [Zobellella aerophila]|uniref:Malonyl-CoA decarboxylase n=1 Tax=Zobellella aerophila TaxID=870480 RepID=A0ABP6VZ85_9GAMM